MKHTIATIYSALNPPLQNSVTYEPATGAQSIEGDQPLAASGTPLTGLAVAFNPNKVSAACFSSTADCIVVLKDAANATLATIEVAEGRPFIWHEEMNPPVALADAFGSDPTATLSVTNVSSPLKVGVLSWRILVDPS